MRFMTPAAALLLAVAVSPSYQQDDGSGGYDDGSDGYDDGSGGYDDGSGGYDDGSDGYDDGTDDSQDDCALISGHNCNANGICKYCAMCLQDGCILSKSASANSSVSAVSQQPNAPSCNTTQFGTDVYDWYGYCLSGGNDRDGDYCATSVECYQYRKSSNSSVSYVWQNLTCDPTSCLLRTDRGQPPPPPGKLPPSDDGDGNHHSGSGGSGHHKENETLSPNSAAAIGLMVTCSCIVLAGLLWVARSWSRRHRRKRSTRRSVNSNDTEPSTAPPSFSSNPEMTQRHRGHRMRASSFSSLHSVEQLPSYFSPDPSPPKYEQAIVTQIRGLMARGAEEDEEGSSSSGGEGRNGRSSNHPHDAHHDPLPPPLWLPVYFTPNHSAFSFGRLRRHPPSFGPGSSSSSSRALHIDDDPMRAFWYHHQQQLEHIHPSPSSSSHQQQQQRSNINSSASNSNLTNNSNDHQHPPSQQRPQQPPSAD